MPLAGEDTTNAVDALVAQVRTGQCVAWIGSGLSIPANYPSWQDTVDRLCNACSVSPLLSLSPSASQLLEKADECRLLDDGAYRRVQAESFGELPHETIFSYKWLLSIPFKAYVTTNIDPLLCTEAMIGGNPQGRHIHFYPDLPPTKVGGTKQSIYYIHGCARQNGVPDASSVIFSKGEFEEAYQVEGASSILVQAVLIDHPLVFLGCQLTEPDIRESFVRVRRILEHIRRAKPARTTPRRIAIVARNADGTIDSAIKDGLEKLEIECFWYTPTDIKRHVELGVILARAGESMTGLNEIGRALRGNS